MKHDLRMSPRYWYVSTTFGEFSRDYLRVSGLRRCFAGTTNRADVATRRPSTHPRATSVFCLCFGFILSLKFSRVRSRLLPQKVARLLTVARLPGLLGMDLDLWRPSAAQTVISSVQSERACNLLSDAEEGCCDGGGQLPCSPDETSTQAASVPDLSSESCVMTTSSATLQSTQTDPAISRNSSALAESPSRCTTSNSAVIPSFPLDQTTSSIPRNHDYYADSSSSPLQQALPRGSSRVSRMHLRTDKILECGIGKDLGLSSRAEHFPQKREVIQNSNNTDARTAPGNSAHQFDPCAFSDHLDSTVLPSQRGAASGGHIVLSSGLVPPYKLPIGSSADKLSHPPRPASNNVPATVGRVTVGTMDSALQKKQSAEIRLSEILSKGSDNHLHSALSHALRVNPDDGVNSSRVERGDKGPRDLMMSLLAAATMLSSQTGNHQRTRLLMSQLLARQVSEQQKANGLTRGNSGPHARNQPSTSSPWQGPESLHGSVSQVGGDCASQTALSGLPCHSQSGEESSLENTRRYSFVLPSRETSSVRSLQGASDLVQADLEKSMYNFHIGQQQARGGGPSQRSVTPQDHSRDQGFGSLRRDTAVTQPSSASVPCIEKQGGDGICRPTNARPPACIQGGNPLETGNCGGHSQTSSGGILRAALQQRDRLLHKQRLIVAAAETQLERADMLVVLHGRSSAVFHFVLRSLALLADSCPFWAAGPSALKLISNSSQSDRSRYRKATQEETVSAQLRSSGALCSSRGEGSVYAETEGLPDKSGVGSVKKDSTSARKENDMKDFEKTAGASSYRWHWLHVVSFVDKPELLTIYQSILSPLLSLFSSKTSSSLSAAAVADSPLDEHVDSSTLPGGNSRSLCGAKSLSVVGQILRDLDDLRALHDSSFLPLLLQPNQLLAKPAELQQWKSDSSNSEIPQSGTMPSNQKCCASCPAASRGCGVALLSESPFFPSFLEATQTVSVWPLEENAYAAVAVSAGASPPKSSETPSLEILPLIKHEEHTKEEKVDTESSTGVSELSGGSSLSKVGQDSSEKGHSLLSRTTSVGQSDDSVVVREEASGYHPPVDDMDKSSLLSACRGLVECMLKHVNLELLDSRELLSLLRFSEFLKLPGTTTASSPAPVVAPPNGEETKGLSRAVCPSAEETSEKESLQSTVSHLASLRAPVPPHSERDHMVFLDDEASEKVTASKRGGQSTIPALRQQKTEDSFAGQRQLLSGRENQKHLREAADAAVESVVALQEHLNQSGELLLQQRSLALGAAGQSCSLSTHHRLMTPGERTTVDSSLSSRSCSHVSRGSRRSSARSPSDTFSPSREKHPSGSCKNEPFPDVAEKSDSAGSVSPRSFFGGEGGYKPPVGGLQTLLSFSTPFGRSPEDDGPFAEMSSNGLDTSFLCSVGCGLTDTLKGSNQCNAVWPNSSDACNLADLLFSGGSGGNREVGRTQSGENLTKSTGNNGDAGVDLCANIRSLTTGMGPEENLSFQESAVSRVLTHLTSQESNDGRVLALSDDVIESRSTADSFGAWPAHEGCVSDGTSSFDRSAAWENSLGCCHDSRASPAGRFCALDDNQHHRGSECFGDRVASSQHAEEPETVSDGGRYGTALPCSGTEDSLCNRDAVQANTTNCIVGPMETSPPVGLIDSQTNETQGCGRAFENGTRGKRLRAQCVYPDPTNGGAPPTDGGWSDDACEGSSPNSLPGLLKNRSISAAGVLGNGSGVIAPGASLTAVGCSKDEKSCRSVVCSNSRPKANSSALSKIQGHTASSVRSAVKGIYFDSYKKLWRVQWNSSGAAGGGAGGGSGGCRRVSRSFSCARLGFEAAKARAVAWMLSGGRVGDCGLGSNGGKLAGPSGTGGVCTEPWMYSSGAGENPVMTPEQQEREEKERLLFSDPRLFLKRVEAFYVRNKLYSLQCNNGSTSLSHGGSGSEDTLSGCHAEGNASSARRGNGGSGGLRIVCVLSLDDMLAIVSGKKRRMGPEPEVSSPESDEEDDEQGGDEEFTQTEVGETSGTRFSPPGRRQLCTVKAAVEGPLKKRPKKEKGLSTPQTAGSRQLDVSDLFGSAQMLSEVKQNLLRLLPTLSRTGHVPQETHNGQGTVCVDPIRQAGVLDASLFASRPNSAPVPDSEFGQHYA